MCAPHTCANVCRDQKKRKKEKRQACNLFQTFVRSFYRSYENKKNKDSFNDYLCVLSPKIVEIRLEKRSERKNNRVLSSLIVTPASPTRRDLPRSGAKFPVSSVSPGQTGVFTDKATLFLRIDGKHSSATRGPSPKTFPTLRYRALEAGETFFFFCTPAGIPRRLPTVAADLRRCHVLIAKRTSQLLARRGGWQSQVLIDGPSPGPVQ